MNAQERDAFFHPAPADLRARITRDIGRAPGADAAKPAARTFYVALGLAWAASLVVVARLSTQEATGGSVAEEVVASHVRSTMAEHLTDVASSDRHTVKPWFAGKLDVSPPVIDLTAQGFTLIGGRLDYLDARPIGAVVYKRRAHVINLFVAQTSNMQRRGAKTETIQGYNIRSWSDRGLNYWAISDLGADELAEFGEKLEAAAANNKEG